MITGAAGESVPAARLIDASFIIGLGSACSSRSPNPLLGAWAAS